MPKVKSFIIRPEAGGQKVAKTVQASVEIKRPIGDAFELVTDLDSVPRWQAELIEVKDVSETPVRAGVTFTTVLRFHGRRIEDRLLVTAYETSPQAFARSDLRPVT